MLEDSLARKIVVALRSRFIELEDAPDAPSGLGWMQARCEDTLGLHGEDDYRCNLSLRQLKKDVTNFNTESPDLLGQDLLDALENVPVREGGRPCPQAEEPALKDPLARKVVEALHSRVVELEKAPDTSLDDIERYIGWLLRRCEDTLRTGDEAWCNLSVNQLKKDAALFNEDFPGLLDPALVEALQNVPEPT